MQGAGEPTSARRRGRPRRIWLLALLVLVAGLIAFALSRLELSKAGHALVTATPGWLGLALGVMGTSLLFRSISWHEALRAALTDIAIPWRAVVRATMIGVMGSAVFPGRAGEPARVVILSRRLQGPNRELLPIIAGTVFSQTLMNLIALAILTIIALTGAPFLRGNAAGVAVAVAVPFAIVALVLSGPRLLDLSARSRFARIRRAGTWLAGLLRLARRGLVVFARPARAVGAVGCQLFAWALQCLSCYCVLRALHLQSHGGLAAAAGVLLAVNLSAILPATPSNVGVFQAACLVVLAAYGVGSGPGLAYGILLQAIEVITALALGVPGLLGEGLSWREIRAAGEEGEQAEEAEARGSAGERAQ